MDLTTIGGKVFVIFSPITLLIVLILYGFVCVAVGYLIENRHWINLVHGKEVKISQREAMKNIGPRQSKQQQQRGGPDM